METKKTQSNYISDDVIEYKCWFYHICQAKRPSDYHRKVNFFPTNSNSGSLRLIGSLDFSLDFPSKSLILNIQIAGFLPWKPIRQFQWRR